MTLCIELGALWCPVCSGRPLRVHPKYLAISLLMWLLTLTFGTIYFGAEVFPRHVAKITIPPHTLGKFASVRLCTILQWSTVTIAQIVYYLRSPALLAEKQSEHEDALSLVESAAGASLAEVGLASSAPAWDERPIQQNTLADS